MLAHRALEPFDSLDYLFEIKWDGIRCLAFVQAGRVRLQSREMTEMTEQFPELSWLACLPSGTVLDGELVSLSAGKPDLVAVLRRAQMRGAQRIRCLAQGAPVSYVLFDLLFLGGESVMGLSFSVRREALREQIATLARPEIVTSEGVIGSGRAYFAEVIKLDLEGVMAKELDSPYLPGKRSRHWLKIKPRKAAFGE